MTISDITNTISLIRSNRPAATVLAHVLRLLADGIEQFGFPAQAMDSASVGEQTDAQLSDELEAALAEARGTNRGMDGGVVGADGVAPSWWPFLSPVLIRIVQQYIVRYH